MRKEDWMKRKRNRKQSIMSISLLAVMGITLLTSAARINAVKAAPADVGIDSNTFPDETFRMYVGLNYDKDFNGILSADEISQCTSINVNDEGITNLKGIEIFPNLKELSCSNNNLSNLDVSSNTALTRLICNDNNISNLNVSSNTALVYLDCSNNNLSNSNVSNNTALMYLDCKNNNLSVLDVSSNTALVYLDCKNNNLNNLDVSNNAATMTYLDCGNNNLTSLNISNNTTLVYLDCKNNNLSSLNVSKLQNLQNLYCASNPLCSLDLSTNTQLNDFNGDPQLVSIPMYKNGDAYYIDLSGLPLDRKRVSIDEASGNADGAAYNSTSGRINLSKVKDAGDTVQYLYETNGPASLSNTKMTVTLEISEVRDITEPTTEEPTTEEPTTEEPTTEEPTTEQPTTEQPTTEQPSTEQPTTEQPTTEQPTTEQPSTAQPPTVEPAPTQTDNTKDAAPKTGDTTPLYPVIFLLLASLVGGVTLFARRRHKL